MRSDRPWGARFELTIRYLAILVPLLLVFGFALELWLRDELERRTRDDLQREVDLVLDVARREGDRSADRAELARRLEAALVFIEHPTRVSDASGPLARSRRASDAAEAVLEGRGDGVRMERTALMRGMGGGELRVEIAADDAEKAETLSEFHYALAGALLATLLLAGGGGYLLAARALRPVDEIARAAAGIDARSLDARLPPRRADDELGRLVRTLNGMLERIDVGVSAARRFTQDASHEIKTPLAAIRAAVDVTILGDRVPDEKDRRALHAIARECERLERIVRDLLTIARADAGALVEQRERIDLRTVGEEVAEVGEILATERGARLEATFAGEPLPIEGDLARLRQVGLNLVDNALRYGRAGGHVWLRLSRDGEQALLAIEDDGPGVPAEERERVFERFHRVRRDAPGVGLGLAIARAIVREHRGEIRATERPGGGARFEVRVPLTRDGAAKPPHG